MAQRPVFVPGHSPEELVDEIPVEFNWNPGFAVSQKQKNIEALHEGAEDHGIHPVLEVSTKSPSQLGVSLSAFNLNFESIRYGRVTVEAAFQGSKVFEHGGPHDDMYVMDGRMLKKDHRLQGLGGLLGFSWEGVRWPLVPRTAFYHWLYIRALSEMDGVDDELAQYRGFTDIEFNPLKSINCQARSCALYVALLSGGHISGVLADGGQTLRKLLSTSDEPGENDQRLFIPE